MAYTNSILSAFLLFRLLDPPTKPGAVPPRTTRGWCSSVPLKWAQFQLNLNCSFFLLLDFTDWIFINYFLCFSHNLWLTGGHKALSFRIASVGLFKKFFHLLVMPICSVSNIDSKIRTGSNSPTPSCYKQEVPAHPKNLKSHRLL